MKNLNVQELISTCQSFNGRKVAVEIIKDDTRFYITYEGFKIDYVNDIDWDQNDYLYLGDYDDVNNKALIKFEDIKEIVYDESKLGELFDIYEIDCGDFVIKFTLDEKLIKCLNCGKELKIEDRCFRIQGVGNYYSGDLDGCKIDGFICTNCLEGILDKDGESNE